MKRALALCFVLVLFTLQVSSQVFPLNPSYNAILEQQNIDSSFGIHTSLKPVFDESLYPVMERGWRTKSLKNQSKFLTHLSSTHLWELKKEEVYVTIDPLLDISLLWDESDTSARGNLYNYWRGVRCAGRLGRQVSFQTDFVEVQTRPVEWQRKWIDSLQIYPGYGRVKPFEEDAFDFAVSSGSIQYNPTNALMLRLGSERQFIGSGYRSLLWSDAVFPTPFMQVRLKKSKGRLQYSTAFHLLQTLERLPKGEVPESLFKRKGASVHYLTIRPNSGTEIGLFESVIWNMFDTRGSHGPDYGAYIPVFGLNTILLKDDTVSNSVMGIQLSQKLQRRMMVYGQFVSDNFKAKRIGWQAGYRVFDPGVVGLNILIEWNHCSPYLYAFENPLQSYSHIQQALGHPAGGSLDELIFRLAYGLNRWQGRVHFSYLEQSLNAGADVLSDPLETTFSPPPAYRTLLNATAEFAFVINPANSLECVAGYQFRQEVKYYNGIQDQQTPTRLMFFGLRTAILSRYSDF